MYPISLSLYDNRNPCYTSCFQICVIYKPEEESQKAFYSIKYSTKFHYVGPTFLNFINLNFINTFIYYLLLNIIVTIMVIISIITIIFITIIIIITINIIITIIIIMSSSSLSSITLNSMGDRFALIVSIVSSVN